MFGPTTPLPFSTITTTRRPAPCLLASSFGLPLSQTTQTTSFATSTTLASSSAHNFPVVGCTASVRGASPPDSRQSSQSATSKRQLLRKVVQRDSTDFSGSSDTRFQMNESPNQALQRTRLR